MEFDPEKSPTYIFRHPFRFVKPYEHAYETHAKKRWLGKQLIQTLAKQFQAYSQQYFNEAIKSGKVTINGKIVSPEYVIKNSDLLRHETVREQPPVLDLPIEIIFEDQDFLVVDKPPSMVVHTGGGYHFNTMMAILHYQMSYKNLYILHRLDRLTSGLVILAKKKQKATKFHEQSMEEVMKKCYYARVLGSVDFSEKTVDAPLICLSHREGIWGVYDPNRINDMPHGEKPKESCTKFVKVWYDQRTDSTLLQCYPITGRTHQIRVHLQHIGHSILNDTCYDGKFVGNWIVSMIKDIKLSIENDKQITDVVEKKIPTNKINKPEQKQQQTVPYLNEEWFSKWDYSTRPMQIFLHSFRYKFQGKQYTSRKPYWVDPHINFQVQSSHQQEKKEQKLRSNYEEQFLKKKKQEKQFTDNKLKQKQQQQPQKQQKQCQQKQQAQQQNNKN